MLSCKDKQRINIKGFNPILFLVVFLVVGALYNHLYAAVSLNLYQILGEDKGFISPCGVTADSSNNVYIADYSANKVYKLTPPPTINVTTFINIDKPLAVAFYNSKLYVVSESLGGRAYNIADGTYANISFGSGFSDYRDIKKAADMTIDSGGKIYVVDMKDNLIKVYNSSGSFLNDIGGQYPITNPTSYGNGLFYIVSTLAYDSSTNRLLVGDTGNTTAYIQSGSKYNYKTKQWTKSSKLFGKPKGKVQVYNLASSTWIRQAVGHGNRNNYGQTYDISGLWLDTANNHLYIVDADGKKIIIIDNFANDTKAPLWTTRSAQDQQELKINEVAVADSPEQDPISQPSRYTFVQSVYDLSAYFGLFKDVIKVGNYLIVTDRTGKVFYFTVTIN